MRFKFGYDRPQQAPVPTPNHPCAIQYRPMFAVYPRGCSYPAVYAETKHKALVVLAGYWKADSS